MRIFLITLLVSTIVPIVFWLFGLAQRIWLARPMLAATVIPAGCGVLTQTLLSHDAASKKLE